MRTGFSDAQEALSWLYSMQWHGVKLGLENVRELMQRLDLPGPQRFIHVAGTNGKGSTCAFAHALLTHGVGMRAGLFTSPHLMHFSERIRDAERCLSGDELREGLGRLREVAEAMERMPTFFELTVALGLDWFRARQLPWAVLEVGLGGRLDATNVVTPEVCVVTSISRDHASILGEDVRQIAREKAGIFKPGVPVVTGPQAEGVLEVLEAVAREKGAAFHVVEEPWTGGALGLAGVHQRWNAALAVAAVQAAGFSLDPEAVAGALEATRWAGRFQRWDAGLVLDCAHNPDGVAVLTRTWLEEMGEARPVLVAAMAADKEVEEMTALLGQLKPAAWVLPRGLGPRLLAPEELARVVRDHAPAAEVVVADSVAEAIQRARSRGGSVLVAGSIFLVGEALAQLQGEVFEKSAQ
ncbi:MAG: hypothetical protein KDK99_09945 [Verrucomicrobiales bacterium]|nr:hypothetical protein [Verrucomicrobiales bacterium]